MAQTNNQIIEKRSLALIMEGKMRPDEEIHTFSYWKSAGYSVKKGERAVDSFPIWKYSSWKKKVEDGEDEEEGGMFLKRSHFFKTSQVEKAQAKA